VALYGGTLSWAQDSSDLAKKSQNPISDMISLPVQNNFNFGMGQDDNAQYILNIQPVYPVRIFEGWNLVNRLIIPYINLPELAPGVGDASGLGDIQYQGYFSPAEPGEIIWGVGPVFSIPSATEEILGSDKWSIGPGIVVLTIRGPWVFGGLINNIWSFAGEDERADVNQMLINPFVNYNMPGGWYLTSAPNITANWEADDDDRWILPIGGGIGKIFNIGNQPINAQLSFYYNIEHPDNGPEWLAKFQFTFLFPK
jgi:hypothetical protein